MVGRLLRAWWVDVIALAIAGVVFVIPFLFILVTAAKNQADAARLEFTMPTEWLLVDNLLEVIGATERPDGDCDAEQPDPDRGLRDADRPFRSDGWLRAPA